MRLVRREGRTSSARLVLLRFGAQAHADDFFLTHGGRAFCSLEPELLCQAVFVRSVQFDGAGLAGWTSEGPAAEEAGARKSPVAEETGARKSYAAAAAGALIADTQKPSAVADTQKPSALAAARVPSRRDSSAAVELPSCPVCLERLDEDASGIVTTLCNHRFHNDCLRHWGDSSCPVCRYCQPASAAATHCSTCACSTDLWVCLICGHVGCGRYRGSHAARHWHESGHAYALELGTQRVWDYLGDAYVHRLVQGKTGKGQKLVEVEARAGAGRGPGARCGAAAERWDSDSDDGAEKEILALSKYDAIVQEYNHLLVTQLESQRAHFEGLLLRDRELRELREQEAACALADARKEGQRAQREAAAARQGRLAAEGKLVGQREREGG